MKRIRTTPFRLALLSLASAVSLSGFLIQVQQTQAAASRKSLRRVSASPRKAGASAGSSAQNLRVGAFEFGSEKEISYEGLKTGGARFTLNGNAYLTGPGRTITANLISIDVPRNANDISVGRASGNVRMSMAMENDKKMIAEGSSLIYRRAEGQINLGGGVRVRSDLEEGGSVDATGNTAEVRIGPGTATLNGNVRLALVKPDTIVGPGIITGPSMTVDLRTGNWKMFGGRGNFNLKQDATKKEAGKQ